MLLDVKIMNPTLGVVITGLVIGKGANFAHDFFHSCSKTKICRASTEDFQLACRGEKGHCTYNRAAKGLDLLKFMAEALSI